MTKASSPDGLIYPGHLLRGSYPSAEMQLAFSTATADWTLFSVYISDMRYYVHYIQFSNYCPHHCRHVYHNVSAVVRSGLRQVVGMSNLTLYFAYRGRLF